VRLRNIHPIVHVSLKYNESEFVLSSTTLCLTNSAKKSLTLIISTETKSEFVLSSTTLSLTKSEFVLCCLYLDEL
jgi:hypothetical protein